MVWQRNLWVLCTGAALASSSYTMCIPFLPLYLLELGVSQGSVTVWSGAVFSATFLVAAILAPYWGRLADRSGKKRMVLRAGFCLAVTYFLGYLVRTPYELLGMRLLMGVANGFVPAAFAIVSSSVPENKIGQSLGFMQTGLLVGGILGPLLGGALAHVYGMRQSFVVAALLLLLATAAAWLLVEEPKTGTAAKAGSILDDIRTALANRPLIKMLWLLLLVNMTMMVLQPLITVYVAELQGTLAGAELTSGFIFGLAGIAGAIAAPLWGKFGQKLGFFRILVAALACSGVINSLQYFIGSIVQFAVIQFVFGLFIAGVLPAINAMVIASTDHNFRGRAFGLTTSANQIGSMLGPLLGGVAGTFVGIKAVFVLTGLLLLVAALAVWQKAPTITRARSQ
jgi:DHA1 family multidrug resistance protein-like MFS transporter